MECGTIDIDILLMFGRNKILGVVNVAWTNNVVTVVTCFVESQKLTSFLVECEQQLEPRAQTFSFVKLQA